MSDQTRNIEDIVRQILSPLGFTGDVSVLADTERVSIQVQTDNAGMLIGRGGENLRALQHLLLLIISKRLGYSFAPGAFSFDINNYRKERENYLVSLAKNVAYEVRETKHERELDPMPPSERRVIHAALAAFEGVSTQSVGDRRDRRVVVRPAFKA